MFLQILDGIGSSRLLTYVLSVCLASLQKYNLTDHVSKRRYLTSQSLRSATTVHEPQPQPQPAELCGRGPALRSGDSFFDGRQPRRAPRPQDFQDVLRLRHLDLQGNVIAQVERLTFANVRKDLRFLDLSRNRMEFLQGCLQSFTSLKTLNLSHNRIEGFTPGEFYSMNRLTELHLEGNRITTLGSEIHALTLLKILSISNNQIRTISTNQLPPKLTRLYLSGQFISYL
ncbi:uncharacterized protein CEXT_310831 [Caerostris extrusa]|uniref:Uncharacterized protein n=1 Tax=Caerostris extrusa TaxID=172846 RepID=A0AAV4S4Q8_CAEEX|nr:uncharacterized protein CEXT_310831 [Caerostris extrusa]